MRYKKIGATEPSLFFEGEGMLFFEFEGAVDNVETAA